MAANVLDTNALLEEMLRPDRNPAGLDMSFLGAGRQEQDGVNLGGYNPAPAGTPGGAPSASGAPAPLGFWPGLGRNLLWNLNPQSLIGDKPDQDLQDWQAEHPWANLGSAMVGSAPYYVAGAGLGGAALRGGLFGARAAGLMSKAAPFAVRAPIASAAVRTGLELVPFEGARLAASAAFAQDPEALTDTGIAAGLDLATAGLFGGGAQFIRQLKVPRVADPGHKLKQMFPDFDETLSAQEQLQRMYQLKSAIKPEEKEVHELLDAGITQRMGLVRFEGTNENRYVKGFVGEGDAKDFRRFFKTQQTDVEGASILRRRFMTRPVGGFKDEQSWIQAWKETGLPEEAFSYIQYPRQVSFGKEAGAKDFQDSVKKSLAPVANGWWLREEADTGLYVMAKKLTGSETAATPADKWVLFKTSEPNKLVGDEVVTGAANRSAIFYNKVQQKINAAAKAELLKSNPEALDAIDDAFVAAVPKQKWLQKIAPTTSRIKEMMPEELLSASKEMQTQLGDHWQWFKGLVAPAQAQFRYAPQAEYTRMRAQNLYAAADAKANMALYGDQWQDKGQNLYKSVFGQRKVGGLKGAVDGLKDEDMPLVTSIIGRRLKPDEANDLLSAAPGEQRQRIMAVLNLADELQAKMMNEVRGTQKIAGLAQVEPMEGHYGVPHLWQGSWRMRVEDEMGRTLAYGSGKTAQEAVDSARALTARYGGSLAWDRPRKADAASDELAADLVGRIQRKRDATLKSVGSAPMTHLDRQGVLGFLGGEKPLSRDELFDIMKSHYGRQYKYVADTLVRHKLAADVIESGRQYGKEVFDQLGYRIAKMSGAKGWIDKGINEGVDKLLAPALGHNSADRIAGAVNQTEFALTQLFGNLGFPISNALTFVQTALPKIALVLRTPPERLMEFYHFAPAFDKNGQARGITGILEPIKISSRAFKSMAKPDDIEREIFARGAREGVVAPKYVEEFLGEKSRVGGTVREALQGKGGWGKLIRNLSEWPAAKTEEFSRAHALMIGSVLGRRLFGIDATMSAKDRELLYQFAKQFAFRSMYQYSTADRSKIFNGPIGGMAGLFKNWMFHNIADFGTYAGEAARGNLAPLAYALAGTGAVAGVGGLPLYGAADQISRWVSDKSLMQQIYSTFGSPDESNFSDAIYYGLPALAGVSLQNTTAGPFSNPVKDLNFLFNFAVLDRASKIGKLFGDTYSQWEAGQNPFEDDRTLDLAAYAFAPRTLYKALAQVEDGALKSIRNGAPIVDVQGMKLAGIDTNWLKNTFGLTPPKIARAYQLSEELHSDQDRLKAMTTQYGEAYARAMERGDSQGMQAALAGAMGAGADLGKVMRSAQARIRAQQRDALEYDYRMLPGAAERLEQLGLWRG